jgi:pyridoxine/pyridoxamine 5'-phosphate oxidase
MVTYFLKNFIFFLMERFSSLEQALRQSWNLLFQATVKRHDPMRTPTLATARNGVPRARTVVLREVDTNQRRLLFFTDRRSGKVEEIQGQTQAACTFWHPQRKVQVRLRGTFQLESDTNRALDYWKKLNDQGRASYATLQPPGTPASVDTSGLPEQWPSPRLAERAYQNFCLLDLVVTEMEVLHLHPAGHQRAFFRWEEGTWSMTWLIP